MMLTGGMSEPLSSAVMGSFADLGALVSPASSEFFADRAPAVFVADDFAVAVFATNFAVDFAVVDFLDFLVLDWTAAADCPDGCSVCCSDCADRSVRSATCLCRSDSLSADSVESDEPIESATSEDADDVDEDDVEPVSSDDIVEADVTAMDCDRSDRRSAGTDFSDMSEARLRDFPCFLPLFSTDVSSVSLSSSATWNLQQFRTHEACKTL
ncbi:hypothetical protein [Bifidobacterium callimiconis]|uniref:hypothetical protein n=1 Tax=Bifidobacterium callimiconis TaxID=2306973 RepID=UPI001F499F42|nr:hypothetical protein [Bifidobacterium callimiconis]